MNLDIIKKYAAELVGILSPFCKRIEIAGSIRREQQDCKDIEIVCIPDKYNLEKYFVDCKFNHYMRYNFIKNGQKHKQFKWRSLTIDLFTATPSNWGWIYFLRTGNADWNKRQLNSYRRIYKFSDERDPEGNYLMKASIDGWLVDREGKKIVTAEEQDVFDLLQLNFIEPPYRY